MSGHSGEDTTSNVDVFDTDLIDKIHFISSGIIGTILFAFGSLGNILSILIWSRKSMRSSTGMYLIGLAIADLAVLVFFFVSDSIKQWYPELETNDDYAVFYSYIGYPLFYLCVFCSIWATVGVTVDRYIQVCWIAQAKTLCSEKRAVFGLVFILLMSAIANVPRFLIYHPVLENERNVTDEAIELTDFGNTDSKLLYEFWIHCILLELIPVFIIFLLNILIIFRVRRVNKRVESKRGDTEKTRKTESQMTKLLLTVTFTFTVLISFECVSQTFCLTKSGNRQMVRKVRAIAKLGVVINSAINFLLYCISGRRFRKQLSNVICYSLWRLRPAPASTTTNISNSTLT